jgi:hypothetical protein
MDRMRSAGGVKRYFIQKKIREKFFAEKEKISNITRSLEMISTEAPAQHIEYNNTEVMEHMEGKIMNRIFDLENKMDT